MNLLHGPELDRFLCEVHQNARRFDASTWTTLGTAADINISSFELASDAPVFSFVTHFSLFTVCTGNASPLGFRLFWATQIANGAETIRGAGSRSPNTPGAGEASHARVRGRSATDNAAATNITATRGAFKGRGGMTSAGVTAAGLSPATEGRLVERVEPLPVAPGDGLVVGLFGQASTSYTASWGWIEVARRLCDSADQISAIVAAIRRGEL